MRVDVIVIGAGIQGVGVAQAVAAAGYSVLILEKNAPASGTSSKSSKLIHGGLRYLESSQFKLVRECLHERQMLLKNAPDLVQLKPFYIPVYEQTSRPPWKIRAGLSLYYALSGFRAEGKFRRISPSQWQALDGLQTNDLRQVFQYWDAQTNDALLTQAVLRSAQSLGAEMVCPAEVTAGEHHDALWEVHCRSGEKTHTFQARVVVNAAGPWVNSVLRVLSPKTPGCAVDLVQGTHVLLPTQTREGIYYLEAPSDRRAVFVMPWGGETLVGTTEKLFTGRPEDVAPTKAECEYLLDTVRYYFPRFAQFNEQDLSGSFAGLRVLPSGKGSAFSRARDTIIHEDRQHSAGLFTLYGGKLTAYRATAEQVMQKLRSYLPARASLADTRRLKLSLD